jgi:hypothetical protein
MNLKMQLEPHTLTDDRLPFVRNVVVEDRGMRNDKDYKNIRI